MANATKATLKVTELAEFLTKHQREQKTARLVQTTDPELRTHIQTGAVTGTLAAGEWEGDPSWPLWAGYPFTTHRAREEGDPHGIYVFDKPERREIGGKDCLLVASDPACGCLVFLDAELYEVKR